MNQQTELQQLIAARFNALKIKNPRLRAEITALLDQKAQELHLHKQAVQMQADAIQTDKRLTALREERKREEADAARERYTERQSQLRTASVADMRSALSKARGW